MKNQKQFKKSMRAMAKHGPTDLTTLAGITGEKRVALARWMEFCEYHGLVTANRDTKPIQYTASPDWEGKFDAHIAKRDKAAVERGERLKAAYPSEKQEAPVRNRGYVAKQQGTVPFDALLAASMAIRPEVRTTWRSPAPHWA